MPYPFHRRFVGPTLKETKPAHLSSASFERYTFYETRERRHRRSDFVLVNGEEGRVSSRENPAASWTYRMEVSPTGQAATPVVPPTLNDPIALLHVVANLQSQTLETMKQLFELQRQQFELIRESTHVSREQRSRQGAELEKWQMSHEDVIEPCKTALTQLEQVHSNLMGELARYVDENHDNLLDGDFSLSDFVDRFGPRLAHLNTILAILRPLAAHTKKTETANTQGT